MADLGPRRTRLRGVQNVTADKSEVGPATRGQRGSGRVRPSVGSMASPGVSVVLVMLFWIFHAAEGTRTYSMTASVYMYGYIVYIFIVFCGQSCLI